MKIDLADMNQKELHGLLVGAIFLRPVAFVSTMGEDRVFSLAAFTFLGLQA
jgi:hypothetical protein